MKTLSRRKLLKMMIAAAGGLGVGQSGVKALAQTFDQFVYLPLIIKSPPPDPSPPPPPTGSRVVHVHDPDATNWNFDSSWYGNYIDQNAINTMVAQGITALTGIQDLADAWRALIPYQSGEGVAIKVNFNNAMSYNCDGDGNRIDAVSQPIIAIISGLISIGVSQDEIWIFDAKRKIPARFIDPIRAQYPNVRFYAAALSGCPNTLDAHFADGNPSARIDFWQPLSPQYVPEVLVNAAHLINVPIMKKHWIAGVSLGFKHHFGTIPHPSALHDYIDIKDGAGYSSSRNPLVNIYQNANIGTKTRLVLADGLFCCLEGENDVPRPWTSFNNDVPNSLLFATDPVAIDCVMCDFLNAEAVGPNLSGADDYLKLAAAAGLGTFERASSLGAYNQIEYMRFNL